MSVLEVRSPLSKAALLRELVALAWPITVSSLSFTVMTVVDTAFVGRLGPAALAGVGLGGIALWTVICFGFGLMRAVKVLVAQGGGAGGRREVLPFLGAGLYAALALGVLAIAIGLPLAHYLPHFSASAEAGRVTITYMSIRLYAAPIVMLSCALREARYGFGDSRSPMYVALVTNFLHIPLNYALIFGAGWGIAGAAYATVFVQLIELVWMLALQRKEGFGLGSTELRHVLSVFKLGVPTGTEFFLGVGAFSALVLLIARMSEVDLAAHQVALMIVQFGFMPAISIGEAASVLAGRAVGANDDRRVLGVAKSALFLAGCYALLSAAVFVLAAVPLLSLFTTDARVQHMGVLLLYVASGFQFFDAANIVARAVLRGTGDVHVPALAAVCSGWLFLPGLTWFWGMHHRFGAVGAWYALTVDICVSGVFFWWRLGRGDWLRAARESRARLAREPETPLVQAAE